MPNVHWDWVLMMTTSSGAGSSHRVARLGTTAIGAPATANHSGDDEAQSSGLGWNWTPSDSARAPASLPSADGKTFVFAFWWIRGGTTGGVPVGNSVVRDRGWFGVPVGGDGNAAATAFYVWDFGVGPGANAILIDAFDQETGFFPEDFVNIRPGDTLPHNDPASLYFKANDGYLRTEGANADVTQQQTLTAFDGFGRKFSHWLEVPGLTYPGVNGPTINGTDVVVMPSARLVAFAVYTTPARPPFTVRNYEIYDPWWSIKTHGGLTPPLPPWGPPEPWAREYLAALLLAQAAGHAAPKARVAVLKAVLDQLAATAALIKKELRKER